MITQRTQIEVKVGEKSYTFQLEQDAPIDGVLDAMNIMRNYVVGRKKEIQDQQQAAAAAQAAQPKSDDGNQQ